MPVWANAFGNAKQQALWMTYLMITSPLGVIMGYIMNSMIYASPGWRYSFYIQSLLLLPSLIGLIFIPNSYFDLNSLADEQDKLK